MGDDASSDNRRGWGSKHAEDPEPSASYSTRTKIGLERIMGSSVAGLTGPKRRFLVVLLEQPGLSITELAITLGVSHTTASRHLTALRKLGLVTRENEGNIERHYVVAAEEPRALSWLKVVLQDPRRYAIVEYLVRRPNEGKTVNRIASELKVYHGYLVRTLMLLEKQGLLEIRCPRSRTYVEVKPILLDYWEQAHEGDHFQVKVPYLGRP